MIRTALLAILLAACTSAPVSAGPPASTRSMAVSALVQIDSVGFVEVTGTGRVSVAPGRAEISFAVETEGASASDAAAQNADRMIAVLAALRRASPEVEIETHGYDLHPRYSRPPRGEAAPQIVGYTAINNVRVRSDDLEVVGGLIDAATSAGANRVASLSFLPLDVDSARLEALDLAVRRAREEAETIAAALGVPLGLPLEVRGGAQAPPVVPMRTLQMAEATPIEPAAQTVRATVTIKYRLGRR